MQSDYSELVDRLKTWRPGSYQGWLDQASEAATAITTLQAELASARETAWNEAIEVAARVAYMACAQTRHVTLGDQCVQAIRAMKGKP